MEFRDSRIPWHDDFRLHLGEPSLCSGVALQARRTRRQDLDHVSRDPAAPVLPDLCRGRISAVISDGDRDARIGRQAARALVLPKNSFRFPASSEISLTVIFASQARQNTARNDGRRVRG
jgi:hypothetical protein